MCAALESRTRRMCAEYAIYECRRSSATANNFIRYSYETSAHGQMSLVNTVVTDGIIMLFTGLFMGIFQTASSSISLQANRLKHRCKTKPVKIPLARTQQFPITVAFLVWPISVPPRIMIAFFLSDVRAVLVSRTPPKRASDCVCVQKSDRLRTTN